MFRAMIEPKLQSNQSYDTWCLKLFPLCKGLEENVPGRGKEEPIMLKNCVIMRNHNDNELLVS